MRSRWISPQFVSTNRVDHAADYGELKEMGRRVNEVLGIGTSATHMEWFFGPKGLRFSEIGCRPAGVGAWDLYAAGNEIDLYREWAKAIVHGQPCTRRPSRRYAAGMVALRPTATARSAATPGSRRCRQRYGEWVIDAHLPAAGTATQPVEAGYMANAYVRLRHPDYDVLRGMLDEVGEPSTCTPAECAPDRGRDPSRAAAPHHGRAGRGARADPDRADRHDQRRLAGAGVRRRRARRGARRPDAQPRLYRRWRELLDDDPEYAAAERRLTTCSDEQQALYALRLTTRSRPRTRSAGGTRCRPSRRRR